MIRIGDFSKLSRVSIKALRFYDEMGLLKPISVDRFSGYRFYEYNQLPRLHRILALKDLGFSLEEDEQTPRRRPVCRADARDAEIASGRDQSESQARNG